MGMANGNGGIRFLQEIRNGFSNNITSTENNSSLPLEVNLGFFQKHHYTFWGARYEIRFTTTFRKFSNVDSMKPIYILKRRYRRGDSGLKDMFGQRQLHQNPVHRGIIIEVFDSVQQLHCENVTRPKIYFLLRNCFREYFVREFDVGLEPDKRCLINFSPPVRPFLSCGHR